MSVLPLIALACGIGVGVWSGFLLGQNMKRQVKGVSLFWMALDVVVLGATGYLFFAHVPLIQALAPLLAQGIGTAVGFGTSRSRF